MRETRERLNEERRERDKMKTGEEQREKREN